MNKTAVKSYAVDARKKWIQAIAQQAAFYGCTQSGSLGEAEVTRQLAGKGVFLSASEKIARSNLVNDIKGKGYQNVIEEVAYTWFNRLIAIRFMEVNGYLPSGIRVLSSQDAGRLEPDCVREYARFDFLNQDIAAKLAAESDEKLYRYILVEQCNALGSIMPKMFTHIASYAALLLPERLYIKDGLVYDLTHAISEEDFGEQVEIIGWLYQYYISEKKDEVFAALKQNVKITRENIPAATQLFTPDWIVKYMVENSLGRLWLERGKSALSSFKWKYYIEEAEQEPEVIKQLAVLRAQSSISRPEDIKIIDPCMGSGHILVYAFDVLYQIYLNQGYSERDIPDLIIEHNIYGLDIDERACQLAYFALMMKARAYNRRFFRRDDVPQPQVYAPQGYEDGMEYGSLVKVEVLEQKPTMKEAATLFDTPYEVELNTWNFRRLLHQRYDVVVTNPPYMGGGGMGGKLSEYVKKNYPDSKSDIFAVFIEKCGEILNANGFQAMITQHAWMFLSSYEKLRAKLMRRSIINMAHLGARAFDEIAGEVVQTTTFVVSKRYAANYKASYIRLVDFNSQQAKDDAFLTRELLYIIQQDWFSIIPSSPIAYWVSQKAIKIFGNKSLGDYGRARRGLQTGDAKKFIRIWYEVNRVNLGLPDQNYNDYRWVILNNGGDAKKWYGGMLDVVQWESNGAAIKTTGRAIIPSEELYFRECLTWNRISVDSLSVKVQPKNIIQGDMSPFYIPNRQKDQLYILGLLNSCISKYLIHIVNPTITMPVGDVAKIPVIICESTLENIEKRVNSNVNMSKSDWNDFETSWDFQAHPLIAFHGNYEEVQPLLNADDIAEGTVVTKWSKTRAPIAQAYDAWEREANRRFFTLKANEEELNRIFIDIYGLQDELTPEVEDKAVTVRRADLGREIRSFISYAVGCMFGRYSLDVPGLAFAGGQWDANKYTSYIPEDDNILPITDADYFDDDIVTRFVDFVKIVYGEDTLPQNLEFIANALYPNTNTTARETIRRYFQNDFYNDHCKVYQKRPIYWLFDSGKQNGFKALVYLHRYDKYTVARVRTEYLHPLQRKYEAEVERMNKLASLPETSARDKAEFKKQIEKITKQITECRAYDQIISHIAAQTIEIDLDDGVKVNYEKFQGVIVPRGDGKGTVKMDLLGTV